MGEYNAKTNWLPDDPITEEDYNRIEKGIKDSHDDINQHKARRDNPHQVTKGQVGLGNVANVQQASKAEFDAHQNNKDNPHGVTKQQVGLGNVPNNSTASQAEAEAGTASNRFMTPQRVKQAFDKFIETISNAISTLTTNFNNHRDSRNNPHNVTKGQVGLGNVDDVKQAPATRRISTGNGLTGGGDFSADRTLSIDIATQSEAENGTNNSKVMTPLRAAQAIRVLATSQIVNIIEVKSSTEGLGVYPMGLSMFTVTSADSAGYPHSADLIATLKTDSFRGTQLSLGNASNVLNMRSWNQSSGTWSEWTRYVDSNRNISTGNGLSGGGNLTENRTLSLDYATQAEAEAGSNNIKAMTPLRVMNSINANAQVSKITANNGGVSISMSGATHDFYDWVSGLSRGMHTFYCNGDVLNTPGNLSYRGIVHKTGAEGYAWIIAFDYHNNVFTNYLDQTNIWRGWRTLFTENQIATQAEARNGTNNTKLMTPLRVADYMAQNVEWNMIAPVSSYPMGTTLSRANVNRGPNNWQGTVMTVKQLNNGTMAHQVFFPAGNDSHRLHIRYESNSTGGWTDWVELVTNTIQFITVSFQNGWGGSNLSVFKDRTDTVFFSGGVGSGTPGTVIFTLPPGFRPDRILYIPTNVSNSLGHVEILPNGQVRIFAMAGPAAMADMNFCFKALPPAQG